MHFLYSHHALADLATLPRKTADRITAKLLWYASQDNPLRFAKKLKPPFDDLYGFRIGEYRAIFELDSRQNITLLVILRVRHRKDAYE